MPLLFLIGRILFGGFFFVSGISHFKNAQGMSGYAASKHVPSPKAAIYVSGALLVLGGAGVVFGIAPQWSLLCLVLFLVPTTFIMHQFWKETDPMRRMPERINFMKNIALLGAVLMMFSFVVPWVASL